MTTDEQPAPQMSKRGRIIMLLAMMVPAVAAIGYCVAWALSRPHRPAQAAPTGAGEG